MGIDWWKQTRIQRYLTGTSQNITQESSTFPDSRMAGQIIFILGIVQLYQVSSCLKVQRQKVKAGWKSEFQKEISNNHGFSARKDNRAMNT